MASSLRRAGEERRLERAHEPDPAVASVIPGAAVAMVPQAPLVPAAVAGDGDSSGAGPADSVPNPHVAFAEGPLSAAETAELAACEVALDQLRVAFWRAGKALQTIRDARLYRQTHPTFDDYVQDVWQMSRPQAYRLIDAWPLAQRLSPIGDRLTESQVRVLVPLTSRFGQDAAVIVYQTVAQTEGAKVTAEVLKGAIAVLPADRFEPDEAAGRIRDYLAGTVTPPAPARPRSIGSFTEVSHRVELDLTRISILPGVTQDPEAVRSFITRARTLLGALEQQLPADD